MSRNHLLPTKLPQHLRRLKLEYTLSGDRALLAVIDDGHFSIYQRSRITHHSKNG